MEHPRDIVEALKRDQQLLRIERQKRTVKIKGAMQVNSPIVVNFFKNMTYVKNIN